MAEEQLQVGEVEQIDPATLEPKDVVLNPAPAPAESEQQGGELPPELEPQFLPSELAAEVDAFSAGMPSPFQPQGATDYAPLSTTQLQGVQDLMRSLASKDFSLEDIRKSFNEGVFGTSVDEAMADMLAAQGDNKRQSMMQILNRGDLPVSTRIGLLRELDAQMSGPDMNAVERTQLRQLNEQENGGYTDEAEAAYEQSLKLVAGLPVIARPETGPLTTKEMQQSYEALLNMAVIDSEKRAGGLNAKGVMNFLPQLLPFFGTVPVVKVLKELNSITGGDVGMSTVEGAFMPGTAIRSMRERIEAMPLEQKVQTFAKVMGVLRGNRAIFPTQNAQIQNYLIQSLFYKDLTGQDFIKEATDSENKAYIAAKNEAARYGRLASHEKDEAKALEYVRQRNQWEQKAAHLEKTASGRLWHEYNGVTFSQWLDDMAIIDFAIVAPFARSTVKMGQKAALLGSKNALRIAPDATTKQWIRMLQDPRVRKKMTDLLGEDVAETMLPAAIKGAEEAGVEGMSEMIERTKRIQQEVRMVKREGGNVTAKTQQEFLEEIKKVFGEVETAKIHETKSAYSISEDGIDVVARYGATPTKAFGTYAQAERALSQLPFEGKIVRRIDDAFQPASRSDEIGEYFVEVADSRTYDSSRAAWESAIFPREQVRAPWFLPVNSAIGGRFAKMWNWAYSSSDMFGKDIFNELTSDVMRAQSMQKLHAGFVRTMLSLEPKKQAVVTALLKQGEEVPTLSGKGTEFTVEQIRKMYPDVTDDVLTGYYEARTLSDNMWLLANQQKRAEYIRENVKSIHSSTGHVGFGHSLNSADEAVADIKSAQGFSSLHVFDPETGTFSALKRSDIDKLYADGHKLARMQELVQGKGFQEATHTIVHKTKGKVMEPPMNVLPRVSGYYPHIYQANYVVFGLSKAGHRVALATARSIKDAAAARDRYNRIFERMGDKSPYSVADYQFDRALRDPLTYKDDVNGPVFGQTQTIYGSRSGGTLYNASKQYGDHMVDPVEALLRGMELVSHSVTKGNLIKHMEARLYNTLRLMEKETGQKIIKDPSRMVKTIDDINYVSSASKDIQKAVAYMHQIDMVRHIPDAVEQQMALMMTGVGEIFNKLAEKSGVGAFTKVEEKLASAATRGVDPSRLLTEMAHRIYIAGNPIQQFALQLGQAALVLGIAPRDLPMAIAKSVPLQIAVNTRIMMNSGEVGYHAAYKALLPKAAKAFGLSEEQFDKLVGVIERSGLVDTVSTHSQIRTTARTQAMTRMIASASAANQPTITRNFMEAMKKLDDATFGNLSKYGFENGEQLNRLITFQSLYSRDVRRGIANLDNPKYIQSLVGEVNTLVGSMLRETGMGYQRGWLKAAFQFVAFQHKMATMMLFSKNLSTKQKVGLGVSQFLLYGSRGAAHIDAFHRALEKSVLAYEAENPEKKNDIIEAYWNPVTQSFLDGIIFDEGVNRVLRAVGGEDTPGFAWNRRLAPGGGSEMLVDTIIELRYHPTEKIFGLAGKQGSKLWDFHHKVRRYMLASAKGMDDELEPEQRFALLAKEGATIAFSGYDKYLQASVMKSMGGPVSEQGYVGSSSGTYLERALAAALGVTTEDRQALLDATDKYYFDVRTNPKRHKAAMERVADQLFKETVMESIKLKGEAASPEVFEDMQTKLLQKKAMMLSFLTPHEAEVVSEMIGDKIAKLIKNKNSGTSAERAFIEDLTADIVSGKFGDKESLEWETYLRRTPLYQHHPEMMGPLLEARRQMLTYEDEEE